MLAHRHRKNYNIAGHAHELTFSCYRGHKFLNADRTRRWLTDAINVARVEYDFLVWGYVFMPEHVHLIIYPTTTEYDIAAIRRAIKQPVSRHGVQYILRHAQEWTPRITRRRGNRVERLFWQSGGGYDRNVNRPETLSNMIHYAHENPVRRGLTHKAIDWKWSSARHYAGLESGSIRIDPINW